MTRSRSSAPRPRVRSRAFPRRHPRPTRMTSTPSQRRSRRRTCFGTSRGGGSRALCARGQRANHFPGSGAMTSKATLATLRLEGPGAARVPATLAPDWSRRGRHGRRRTPPTETDAWLAKLRGAWRREGAETRTERIVSRVFARGDFGTRRRRAETRAAPAARRRARLRLGRVRVGARAETDGERRRRATEKSARRFSRARRRRVGKTAPISVPSVGVWEAFEFDETLLRFVGDARAADDCSAASTRRVGRADARSARGGFQTGRAARRALARACWTRGTAPARRRRSGDARRRPSSRRWTPPRRLSPRPFTTRTRTRAGTPAARACPGPSRALLRDVPVRFRAGRRVGVRRRAPDPVARRGERVAQPEARQRAARRRPVPALRETRGQVN